MSVPLYLLLLVVVGLLRLAELGISNRNQRRLAARGAAKIPDPHFYRLVIFHTAVLVLAGMEVIFLHRPFIPVLGTLMLLLLVLATALRWWVIAVMAEHWNVQVMDSTRLGVVVRGPFRWIRHPNYAALIAELIALPLIHTAWLTALVAAPLYISFLRNRLRSEEAVLMANRDYVALMSAKPRFIPRLRRSAAKRKSPPAAVRPNA